MAINYEGPEATSGGAGEARSDGSESCDWCGRSVGREAAVRRPEGDDPKTVPMCTDCEFGTD